MPITPRPSRGYRADAEALSSVREVNPFDFWESHSSAIKGLGGPERSPDPRYLFHTRYHEVRSGRARFVLTLAGVNASCGELSVRLHAWRPDSDANASLVSGGRMLLEDSEGAELVLPVHFASQKGVLYALYGYLTENSDITAQSLRVVIDEPEETGDVLPEPPRSQLALDRQAEETRPANALLHYGRVETDYPVSQSCTVDQLSALGLLPTGFFGRDRATTLDVAMAQWSETMCLNALRAYGVTHAGLEGLVVSSVATDYADCLTDRITLTRLVGGPPPPPTSDAFFDFLLMPDGPPTATDAAANARERWNMIEDWLTRLKIGGMAMLGLRYRADSDLVSSTATSDTQVLSRNEIGQWSLRLIGNGYSVAPLAFAALSELAIDSRGLAGFVLIVQRL